MSPLLLVLFFILSYQAAAEDWPIYGSRSMGMGGAGVASARGSGSIYWNPAALGRSAGKRGKSGHIKDEERSIFDMAGGLSLNFILAGDVIEDVNTLRKDVETLDFDALEDSINSGTPLSEEDLQTLLRIVTEGIPALNKPDEGLLVNTIMGPTFRLSRFGLGFFNTTHGAITPVVDLENIGIGNAGFDGVLGPGQDRSGQLSSDGQTLADDLASTGSLTQNQAEELVYQAEVGGIDTSDPAVQDIVNTVVQATTSTGSILDNESGVKFQGAMIQELSLGYGQPIGDWLAIGVAVKGMHAYTSYSNYVLRELTEVDNVLNDFEENNDSSFNFGVDAGVLLTPTDWLAVGVTGKNLNRPAFDKKPSGHFVLDPSARAGVAVFPASWLMFAADIDLFRNHNEFLPGYRSQMVGGGVEVDLSLVALRAGISKNIAESDEEIVLHAGLALRLWRFSLEAAAMMTPTFDDIGWDDLENVPQRGGVSITLGLDVEF